MDIAILSLDFRPAIGGVQNYLYEIGQRLAASHRVIAITSSAGALPPDSLIEKMETRRATAWDFWHALRSAQPDVVLVGHAHPRLLIAAALYRPQRCVAIAHGNDFIAAQRKWWRGIFNGLLRRARPLATVSEASAARLRESRLEPQAVIYPGVDPDFFRPAACRDRDSCVLLTVGRLVPEKGVDTVLYSLAALKAKFPKAQYHIVGDGPDRARLEELCYQLGLASHVEFRGAVPYESLPAYYQRADVFVMPTRAQPGSAKAEAFGMVYLEASACGLPIVASRIGGVPEAVREGETGVLVPPNDVDALSQALEQVLLDGPLRERFGKNGREWVESTMNWDRAARRVESLLTGDGWSGFSDSDDRSTGETRPFDWTSD